MRATIDKAGRLVITKPIRDRLGLRSGEVEVEVIADGAGLRVELLADDDVGERAGRLVVPATGTPWTTRICGPYAMATSASPTLLDTSAAVPGVPRPPYPSC
ncbi:MAG TPA: AbrB/MazE/SpoVT family DNA-binding domain-containing protein [Pseudonocardiaceae bacterium]|nr:AbrB/MazE/SpoVT family DNA-binding domain-containing protein [Pseudonocardiaceae bacterium]